MRVAPALGWTTRGLLHVQQHMNCTDMAVTLAGGQRPNDETVGFLSLFSRMLPP
jgi:hypothetical protein